MLIYFTMACLRVWEWLAKLWTCFGFAKCCIYLSCHCDNLWCRFWGRNRHAFAVTWLLDWAFLSHCFRRNLLHLRNQTFVHERNAQVWASSTSYGKENVWINPHFRSQSGCFLPGGNGTAGNLCILFRCWLFCGWVFSRFCSVHAWLQLVDAWLQLLVVGHFPTLFRETNISDKKFSDKSCPQYPMASHRFERSGRRAPTPVVWLLVCEHLHSAPFFAPAVYTWPWPRFQANKLDGLRSSKFNMIPITLSRRFTLPVTYSTIGVLLEITRKSKINAGD